MSKRKHNQEFKDSYEAEWPVLKRSKVSANFVYCSVCNFDFSIAHGGKDDCRRHVETARHIGNAKNKGSSKDIKSMFIKSSDCSVINAEVLFSNFLIEHNIPISAADHAGPLFRKMFPDSNIASKYGCARTKTTAIIKSFSDNAVQELASALKKVKFSLATDGSNNNGEKLYPMLVTYFDISMSKNVTMLLSLPKLTGDSTGENIFLLLDSELKRLNIPWENCSAFCSDNASVMTGRFKGVIKFIKEKNPRIVFSACACHLVHLVAQHSAKKLHFPFEEFLVDIYYYLKKSSKRLEALKMCQDICDVEIHKILKYGSTRWLSMENVIKRIIEQWEPLKMFFCEKEKGESDAFMRIKSKFQDSRTLLYLFFLESVLPLFTSCNTFLQQEAPLIHKLKREFTSLYSSCLSRFIKPAAIANASSIFEIDITDKKVQKSHYDLIIGSKTKQYLNSHENLTDSQKKDFFNDVRAYYAKACTYILEKFPMKHDLLENAEVADIKLRLETSFRLVRYFIDLFYETTLTDHEINALEEEFALYQIDKFNEEILNCEREDEAWCLIKNIEDHNRAKKYKKLPDIMLNILLLPHSNAACERVFSTVRKNQTEFRSNLGRETLESILIQKSQFSNKNLCCYKQNFSEKELAIAKKATNLFLQKQ